MVQTTLTLVFTGTTDGKGVSVEGSLDLGVAKVEHSTIILDHVHFLYALYSVDAELTQCVL